MTTKTLTHAANEAIEAINTSMKYLASEGSCLIKWKDLFKSKKIIREQDRRIELAHDALGIFELIDRGENEVWLIMRSRGKFTDHDNAVGAGAIRLEGDWIRGIRNAFKIINEALAATSPDAEWKA